VSHLNRKGAHLRPPCDVCTISSSSEEGGNSPPIKISPPTTPPALPVAGPSSAPDRPAVEPAPVVGSVSSTSLLSNVSVPSMTVSECDAAMQAFDTVASRRLHVGTSDTADSIWRRRFYLVARHLFSWVRETANPQPNSGSVLGNGELLRNCPFEFDATAPMQQLAGEVLPFFQMLANEDLDPGL